MDEQDFRATLQRSATPVIVDVWAPWCMPCRKMAPTVERLRRAYEGQLVVWKVNADESPEVVRSLGVLGIPSLIVFQQGKEVARQTGAPDEEGLTAWFAAAAAGEPPATASLSRPERVLRLLAGTALLLLGWVTDHSLPLLLIGGGVVFSGLYDRCLLWRFAAPRLTAALSSLLATWRSARRGSAR